MYNKRRMGWVLLAVVLAVMRCEEWFMADSRLISEGEFREAVRGDSYKIVKFFTPNCVYCRYLKDIFDKLKHEKHWPFAIYDLNCNWYPRLCQELKIASFPYTAIYDQRGQLNNQITGFYPEPVIRDIFQQIQAEVVALAKQALSNNNSGLQAEQPTNPNEESEDIITPSHEVQEDNRQVYQESKQAKKDAHEVSEEAHEVKEDAHEVKEEAHEVKKENLQNDHLSQAGGRQRESAASEKHSEGLPGIYQHIFFGLVILLGVVYFSSFMDLMKPASRPNPETCYSSKGASGRH